MSEPNPRLFEDIPIGLYSVGIVDGKEIVIDCNDAFARIHGLRSREEMLGCDIRSFHVSIDEGLRFRQAIDSAEDSVVRTPLRIRTANGVERALEVHSRLHYKDGQVIGRTGTVRDITAEEEMRETMETMSNDIGAILHAFKHTLTQVKHSIATVADAIAGSPGALPSRQTPEEIRSVIEPHLRQLAAGVEQLISQAAAEEENDDVHKLRSLLNLMRSIDDYPPPHWRGIWLRGATEIEHICNRLPRAVVARTVVRGIIGPARRVSSIASLATLASAREAIDDIEGPLDSFRDFVVFGERDEALEVTAIETCVLDAINSAIGFADERNVEIRLARHAEAYVKVNRRQITRAIGNLLHNAIKYTLTRENGRSWIDVIISTQGAAVTVTVENLGVPIPREEIDGGLLFRLGFRGRLSSDPGRAGTGVGLADSQRVARSHSGKLRVESRPAESSAAPDDYTVPYLTRVHFGLPLAGAE